MKYRTIVADPPWIYRDLQGSFPGGPEKRLCVRKPLPYGQMKLDDIMALPVASMAEDDACLWLWTTNRHLPDAFQVVAAWGFDFRQVIVWHKTGNPAPFFGSVAPNHTEYLLHCRRGNPQMLGHLPSNVIQANKPPTHSQKPDHFIDFIEQVSPPPYVELFARRHRLGWDVWGLESANTATLEAT